MNESIKKIEAELNRLAVGCTRRRAEGIAVYADDLLPRGWVRVSDGTGTVFGAAQEIAAVLADVPYTGKINEDLSHVDFEATWESLGKFDDSAPTNSHDWPADLITITQIEEGGANDEPLTVVKVETNAGTRYTAGDHGTYSCALSGAFEYDDFHASREAALESYYGLAAQTPEGEE